MKRRKKYSAIKTLKTFQWLLLFAFTTSFAVGTRAGNQLDIFTGEAQAQEVLESQHTASLPELSPTPTLTPSPTTTVTQPISTPPAVEAVDPSGGEAELEEAVVTAYSCGGLKTEAEIRMNCPSLLSGQPRTATGSVPIPLKTVACDRKYLHHQFEIEGIGIVTCTDTGGRIKGNRFDLYVETVQEARQFGVRKLAYKEVL